MQLYEELVARARKRSALPEDIFLHIDTPLTLEHQVELMERAGNTYVPEKPQELPDHCFSVHPSTGELIFIERGKKGYEIGRFSSDNPTLNRSEADRYNLWDRVTPQVEAAMLGGALRGWASPAARVSSYDLRGSLIKPIRTRSRKPKEESR